MPGFSWLLLRIRHPWLEAIPEHSKEILDHFFADSRRKGFPGRGDLAIGSSLSYIKLMLAFYHVRLFLAERAIAKTPQLGECFQVDNWNRAQHHVEHAARSNIQAGIST
jgi:hypothetical protein